ncbi:MAG: hypothetical protein VX649_12200 [Pseudomonadota bacterium]|nr:hypothetical protein [Pseudomonadota bacterium]
MSENRITKSILERYEIYFNIDMQYRLAPSNIQRSRNKIRFALINAARFGFISALVCEQTWGVSRAKALEFLGKLVSQGYLLLAQTERAADRRVYVLTHTGAQFASEMSKRH